MAMKPMIIDLFPRKDSADEPETPLDPERLAAQAGWLRQGIRLAIADLERISSGMFRGVIAAELARVTDRLRQTLAGEQEAGS